jgi:hypothetical protein
MQNGRKSSSGIAESTSLLQAIEAGRDGRRLAEKRGGDVRQINRLANALSIVMSSSSGEVAIRLSTITEHRSTRVIDKSLREKS